jgi:hypothetical protein
MGLTDEIRNAISLNVRIRYETSADETSHQTAPCVICSNDTKPDNRLFLYVMGEGRLCSGCACKYAPDKYRALLEYKSRDLDELLEKNGKSIEPSLTDVEWKDIRKQLDALCTIADDLSKGVARGIVEAPVGHIGLLYLAKDILKPDQKEGEDEKDYELRVKTFRIQKIQEKLKTETLGRLAVLERYFEKLGLS